MPLSPPDRRYVRVVERDERWVEFEFSIGDPAIFVELVMAPAQFRQFCIDQAAQQLPPGGGPQRDSHAPSHQPSHPPSH